MMMLVLTLAEAQALRGATAPGAALDPLPLADGATFVLPLSVLDDPAHTPRRDALSALPSRAVDEAEWAPPAAG